MPSTTEEKNNSAPIALMSERGRLLCLHEDGQLRAHEVQPAGENPREPQLEGEAKLAAEGIAGLLLCSFSMGRENRRSSRLLPRAGQATDDPRLAPLPWSRRCYQLGQASLAALEKQGEGATPSVIAALLCISRMWHPRPSESKRGTLVEAAEGGIGRPGCSARELGQLARSAGPLDLGMACLHLEQAVMAHEPQVGGALTQLGWRLAARGTAEEARTWEEMQSRIESQRRNLQRQVKDLPDPWGPAEQAAAAEMPSLFGWIPSEKRGCAML